MFVSSNLTANDFYFNCTRNYQGFMPPKLVGGDKGRAKKVLAFYNAMATAEERVFLVDKSNDEGEQKRKT